MYQTVDRSCSEHSYTRVLYRIFNALRLTQDVQQRVELVEDRIKTHFRAWLETAEVLHQQSNAPTRRLFLLIDGVDKFRHSNRKQDSRDWLPIETPSFVKIIYSCEDNSKVARYLKRKCVNIITLQPLDIENRRRILAKYTLGYANIERIEVLNDWLPQDCCGTPLYLHLLLSLATADTTWDLFPLDRLPSSS